MIDDIAHQVMLHLPGQPTAPEAPTTSWLLYTNRGEIHSSILAFLFTGSDTPSAVVKLSRNSLHIRREFDALHILAKRFTRLIPSPYLTGETRGFAFVAMEAVDGAPVWERDFGSTLPVALAELIACHRAVQSGMMVHAQIEEELLEPLGSFERAWVPSRPGLARMCRSLRDRIAALRGVDLPYIPQHGDLHLDNLLVRPDGSLALIDWEEFGVVGLPAYDLVTLFTTLDRDPLGRPPLRRLFLESLQRYTHDVGIDPRWRPLLLPLAMMRFTMFCATEGRPQPLRLVLSRLEALSTLAENDWCI